eukprot:gb/GFBE01038480.1/.p1 GENE.gb/GFBE01038480.1/~~gb/GFBE01038480.1/.p1  ORF type:complete len:152 (+),score=15.58 gb/GFBE01038480.1/:1-456(+)
MDPADDYDLEAAQLIAETNAAARQVIIDHLEEHLLRNPDASYASWIAALHPDNVQLDQRLLQEGNEWLEVWNSNSRGADKAHSKLHDRRSSGRRGLLNRVVDVVRTAANLALIFVLEAARGVCVSCSRVCHLMSRQVPRVQRRSFRRSWRE